MYSSTSALDGGEWSASRPWPLYPQGKSPWYPLDRRLGGPQSRSTLVYSCFAPCPVLLDMTTLITLREAYKLTKLLILQSSPVYNNLRPLRPKMRNLTVKTFLHIIYENVVRACPDTGALLITCLISYWKPGLFKRLASFLTLGPQDFMMRPASQFR
jgi:hypothetical protein